MKILILASNPRKDLNLDDEIRLLRSVIDRSSDRDRFEIVSEPGIRVGDLQWLLVRHKPQIVHFCGHGSGEEGLIFKTDEGGERAVGADALANMFGLNPICSHVKCVLLNACYSEQQADAIVSRIDYVVGMSHAIQDNAAIAFSKGFYLALGEGCSIDDSFEFGRNAIQLEISGSSKMRSAATDVTRKVEVVDAIAQVATQIVIPEHFKPILKIKPSQATNPRANITAVAQPLSQEKREEIQFNVAKALTEETPNANLFRERVKEYLQDHQLADYEKALLNVYSAELGLLTEEANGIIEEEQAPIRQAQQAYKKELEALITYYPFNDAIQSVLKKLQSQRNLTDEEVNQISQPIFEQAEIDHKATLRQQAQQEYQNKLQRYEQEFSRAIAAQYPIEEAGRAGLISFHQSLGLDDEDVARIEQPLIAPKEAEHQRQQAEQRQQELEQKRQRDLEQQRQVEAQQRIEEARRKAEELARSGENSSLQTRASERLQQFDFDVITVDQTGNENSRTRRSAEFFSVNLGGETLLNMVKIPAGSFLMGSPEDQGSADERPQHSVMARSIAMAKSVGLLGEQGIGDERPQHSVTVRSFAMAKYAVTQTQWRAVAALPQIKRELNPDPSFFKGDNRPVEQVSWDESVEFCDRLSQLTKTDYRLPSEAEWEYACRAGTTTEFYFGQTLTPKLAQCKANIRAMLVVVPIFSGGAAPVGSYLPNAFGLYDMHGNVDEWCADHKHDNYQGAPIDGSAWLSDNDNQSRMRRGGSWYLDPTFCRSAARYYNAPSYRHYILGFRVVCGLA